MCVYIYIIHIIHICYHMDIAIVLLFPLPNGFKKLRQPQQPGGNHRVGHSNVLRSATLVPPAVTKPGWTFLRDGWYWMVLYW